ncbi:amidohydrolase [Propionibacterium cyclohexanicum]|nr:amidohydrolase [Propionibacterium cyclohexanicum]
MNPAQPVAESMLVDAGRIAAIDSYPEIRARARADAPIFDVADATVLPGLIDVHTHHAVAGLGDLFELTFPQSLGPQEIAAKVAEWVAEHPSQEWAIGGNWGSDQLPRLASAQALALLDAASGGHPVLLKDDTQHNRWANSEAIRRAGFTADSSDPEGGHLVRDASGALTGVLFERAGAQVEQARSATGDLSAAEYARGSQRGIEILQSYGITAIQEAAATPRILQGLSLLDSQGELDAWVVSSMLINDNIFGSPAVGLPLLDIAQQYRSRHHLPNYAKIFMDGVPTARTGAFVEPYLPVPGHGQERGTTTMDVDELSSWLGILAQRGLGAKIHCTGDAAVHVVVEAVERVHSEGVFLPVQIAHGQYVLSEDIPRIAELGIVADISPSLWFPGPMIDAMRQVLPAERAEHLQPNRALLDLGVPIGGGSDFPVSPQPNPWIGIAGLVTRSDPTGQYEGRLWPEQAISVDEAIGAYTLGAARVIGLDAFTGSLEVGKSADFVVLDQDPWDIPPAELARIQVQSTWFEGRQVFARSDADQWAPARALASAQA